MENGIENRETDLVAIADMTESVPTGVFSSALAAAITKGNVPEPKKRWGQDGLEEITSIIGKIGILLAENNAEVDYGKILIEDGLGTQATIAIRLKYNQG